MSSTSPASIDPSATAESNARKTLGLDASPDIESLVPRPTARDRKRFKAAQLATPPLAPSMTLEQYKAKRINEQIIETVRSFLIGKPSLIRHLSGSILRLSDPEELRATPSVFLQRILDTPESLDLTERLLKKLKWYGASPGEQTPASVRYQLICKAICLYLHAPSADEPQELAGFHWQDPTHRGKSYQTLRHDFEQHLLRTGRVANTKEAILLAQVFQTRLSKDFSVRDVPPELRYKTSVVWVNFMHGVLLAEDLGLDPSQPLSFQQLVDLPLERSTGASAEQLEAIARLRTGPALEWAVCTGAIAQRTTTDYDPEDIRRALTALEEQTERLNKAVTTLDLRPPERLQMARQVMTDLFRGVTFERDGRKLMSADPSHSHSRAPLDLNKQQGHDFLDVYADGQLDGGKRWIVSMPDGTTRSTTALRLDGQRMLYAERENRRGGYDRVDDDVYSWAGYFLPDINARFETAFNDYLTTIRQAYQSLIASLLTSLPAADRRALVQGEVQVLSLRQKPGPNANSEQVRARKGFVLKVIHGTDITYYELIPSAGVIRQRTGLRFSTINGVRTEFPLHASIPGQSYSPERNLSTSLLLDWSAHLHGRAPAERASCPGFLDIMGFMPAAVSPVQTVTEEETSLTASRLNEVARYISTNFLFVDEQHLRQQARGITTFDTARAKTEKRLETFLSIVKGFVPFWGSIDDLLSDSTTSKVLGGVGLLFDLASFLLPIGKFISGSVRLLRASAGTTRMAVKASLPPFSTLTRKLLTASLANLNPLDGIPSLLRGLGSGAGRGLLFIGRASIGGIRRLTGHADSYRLVQNLPQAIDPGSWKPLTNTDELATVNGIDDIIVRHTNALDLKQLHLVDPVTSLPYGPRLHNNTRNLIQGRSTFKKLPPTESHALSELPEHAHVREILEVDGRTTMLIDDIPYRLDGDQLRRADLIDDASLLKTLPCRVRRKGPIACKTRFVTGDLAPHPDIGSFDESKGWAPWFGDSIYTPAVEGRAKLFKHLKRKNRLDATMEFQKGIYGRINVKTPYGTRGEFDTFQAGAIIVPAMDESKRYVFTRLDAGAFYVAELPKGQNISGPLKLRQAKTLPNNLRKELMTVYTGSLNANNTARIYGVPAVERALKTMEEIAIPIGGHNHPPNTLNLLKVDTSPGEAVLFDHSTRMIVSQLQTGAASWSRSGTAPAALRQRAADIFDTLFVKKTINVVAGADLRINKTMKKFQKLLPSHLQTENARNIAYADIVTSTGKREVYVSISGARGLTGELPLFKHPFAPDKVIVGDTTYFNIDFGQTFTRTSLNVSPEGKILAIPRTIKDVHNYTPEMTSRPTSLDSESKLISVLRQKYPDNSMITSVDVATTMPPCTSCSVVMKAFGHNAGADALKVLWG
ncbi:deaminase domain-containing protein [Pseudomonas sp. HLG18]|uniref:deaminase domain-containing protein n=1 Tax=Pseudomonas sp. HLG18 TaxID=3449277 RepID=UPI003F7492C0